LQEDTTFEPWFLALSERQCDFSAGSSHGGGKKNRGGVPRLAACDEVSAADRLEGLDGGDANGLMTLL
jgi:hypothetical protein